jgi:hypothetical protein
MSQDPSSTIMTTHLAKFRSERCRRIRRPQLWRLNWRNFDPSDVAGSVVHNYDDLIGEISIRAMSQDPSSTIMTTQLAKFRSERCRRIRRPQLRRLNWRNFDPSDVAGSVVTIYDDAICEISIRTTSQDPSSPFTTMQFVKFRSDLCRRIRRLFV